MSYNLNLVVIWTRNKFIIIFITYNTITYETVPLKYES